ncbi:MAG: hypothetical protein ACI81V_000176 [Lentimonas sp.]|jgi:hypothetical protein
MSEKKEVVKRVFRGRGILFTVIIVSLALHILGAIIFGGGVIFKMLSTPEPALESPPFVQGVEPRKKEYKIKMQQSQKQTSAPLPDPIVADMPSDVKLENLDLNLDVSREKFTVGKLGDGMGTGDGQGNGMGMGMEMDIQIDMNINFFGSSGGGQRIVFVVDYSQSMRGDKEQILRRELPRSIDSLPDGVEFDVILFAGPVWRAMDEVKAGSFRRWLLDAVGIHKGESYRPENLSALPGVKYLKSSAGTRARMIRALKEVPLVHGTIFDLPLYVALTATPTPDTIFFLTDGVCQYSRGIDPLRKLVGQIEARGMKLPVINVVGFEVENNPQLEAIARLTGGTATSLTIADYNAQYGEEIVELPDTKFDSMQLGVKEVDDGEGLPIQFKL